jgi:tungstate transport system permease protein
MDFILSGISGAIKLIIALDPELIQIVVVSIEVAVYSLLLSSFFAVPAGLALSIYDFKGRRGVITLVETLMSLPTVLIGLVVYAMISRQGPFGSFGLLFTKTAIVAGQAVLIFPLITALTVSASKKDSKKIIKVMKGIGADRFSIFVRVLAESRSAVLTALVTALGRVFGEVGISMMLGGNIKGYTRTITTAIALETSKGEFELGIALGSVLLFVALILNFAITYLKQEKK